MHLLISRIATVAILLILILIQNSIAQSETSFFISSQEIEHAKQIKLNTEWLETNVSKGRTKSVTFPYVWEADESQGLRTYYLSVSTNYAKPLGIELPDMYTSFRLFVNNKLLAQSGRVSESETNAAPEWKPQTVALPQEKELNLKLEISNHHHAKGGVKNPIIIGDWDFLKSKQVKAEIATWLLITVLIVMGLGINVYFWWSDMPASALYFSLLCLVWATRVGFSELYIIPSFFGEITWTWVIHIEYLSLFLAIALGLKFMQSIYPLDTQNTIIWVFVAVIAAFVASVSILKPLYFTSWLNLYLSVAALSLVYMIYIVARAVAFARYGATYSVFAVLAGLGAFSYNLMAYQGLFDFNPFMYNISYLIIFVLLAFAMFYQRSKRADYRNAPDVLTFDDYYKVEK
jgi:hypothetical protein